MTNKELTKRTNKRITRITKDEQQQVQELLCLLACGSVEDAGEDGVYIG